MYARRPKVRWPGDTQIEVKFNASLFARANWLSSQGVPVFAGVPCVSTLFDCTQRSRCRWFELIVSEEGHRDEFALVDVSTGEILDPPRESFWRAITDSDIRDTVCLHSRALSWPEASVLMSSREQRPPPEGRWRRLPTWGGLFGGAPYKPVYFLLRP